MNSKKCGICGKTSYPSERKAKEQARWVGRKGKDMRAYYSNMCHTYHLTSEVEFTGRKARRFK